MLSGLVRSFVGASLDDALPEKGFDEHHCIGSRKKLPPLAA